MRVRWMLALVIPVFLGACSTWATRPPPVQPVVAEHAGEHVQVMVAGRAAFDLHDTQVVGDSLVGTTGAGNSYSVAIEDVEYVRIEETDTAKTGLLMAGVMVVTLVVLAVVATAVGTASAASF